MRKNVNGHEIQEWSGMLGKSFFFNTWELWFLRHEYYSWKWLKFGRLVTTKYCCFVRFNNTAYPSEFYGSTGPQASQAQAFTFLVRDQHLGANVGFAQRYNWYLYYCFYYK